MTDTTKQKAQELVNRNLKAREQAILDYVTKAILEGIDINMYNVVDNFQEAAINPSIPYEIWLEVRQ